MVQIRNCDNELDEDYNDVRPYRDEIEAEKTMDQSGYHHFDNENIPTLTHGLVTTVPQNIATLKIGGKHTPTRNSLRHSRMAVMNAAGGVPSKYLPPIVQYHDRAKAIMWVILIVGIIMSFGCSGLKIYAPNTRAHLNPFYATIPILFSGIFGFVHLRCCRKELPGLRRNWCEKSIKVFSITTSLIASVTAFIYFFNIMIHLLSFFHLECAPPDILTKTCICRLVDDDMVTSIFNNSWAYIDLSCFELYNIFNVILALTGFTCLIIIILEIYYLSLHWSNQSYRNNYCEKNYGFI